MVAEHISLQDGKWPEGLQAKFHVRFYKKKQCLEQKGLPAM